LRFESLNTAVNKYGFDRSQIIKELAHEIAEAYRAADADKTD